MITEAVRIRHYRDIHVKIGAAMSLMKDHVHLKNSMRKKNMDGETIITAVPKERVDFGAIPLIPKSCMMYVNLSQGKNWKYLLQHQDALQARKPLVIKRIIEAARVKQKVVEPV